MQDPTIRTTFSILETGTTIQLSILAPCRNPKCPEDFHTINYDTFEEASKILGAYSKMFLDSADVKGEA